jgi:hypothetical protein
MVSIDFVEGRNIFFTTAWVSQIFIVTDHRFKIQNNFFLIFNSFGYKIKNLNPKQVNIIYFKLAFCKFSTDALATQTQIPKNENPKPNSQCQCKLMGKLRLHNTGLGNRTRTAECHD